MARRKKSLCPAVSSEEIISQRKGRPKVWNLMTFSHFRTSRMVVFIFLFKKDKYKKVGLCFHRNFQCFLFPLRSWNLWYMWSWVSLLSQYILPKNNFSNFFLLLIPILNILLLFGLLSPLPSESKQTDALLVYGMRSSVNLGLLWFAYTETDAGQVLESSTPCRSFLFRAKLRTPWAVSQNSFLQDLHPVKSLELNWGTSFCAAAWRYK